MVWRRQSKIGYNLFNACRDNAVNYLLASYNLNTSLLIYNTVTTNSIQILSFILASKFGITSPTLIILIIGFLL